MKMKKLAKEIYKIRSKSAKAESKKVKKKNFRFLENVYNGSFEEEPFCKSDVLNKNVSIDSSEAMIKCNMTQWIADELYVLLSNLINNTDIDLNDYKNFTIQFNADTDEMIVHMSNDVVVEAEAVPVEQIEEVAEAEHWK